MKKNTFEGYFSKNILMTTDEMFYGPRFANLAMFEKVMPNKYAKIVYLLFKLYYTI